ncbi:MAG: phospholipase [Pseudonocardiales bacterium]|nr:phospholipase [Pseudonocardiales bacterium]
MRLALVLATGAATCACGDQRPHGSEPDSARVTTGASTTATPIQHLVVIFPENVSFDHYFGTYPVAANPSGQPAFHAATGTPHVDGLTTALLTNNPNGANPRRLDRSEPFTCDNGHSYTAEQTAFNHGLMDKFISSTGPTAAGCDRTGVMNYYDGNTVTALWNYAQRFAMSDNSHDATFGPTVPGHFNLIAGQTHGAVVTSGRTNAVVNGTLIGNASAKYEDCTTPGAARVAMSGRNIGDLLFTGKVTWGYFSDGFRTTSRTVNGTAICAAKHANLAGKVYRDYIAGAGTEPFQFWASTANPHHLLPRTVNEIGNPSPAHHQYDLSHFWQAAGAGRLPAVSFIKPAVYQNAHPGNSDPLDEQRFLVNTINRIQRLPTWSSTAIVIAYDDSDGWYDHQLVQPLNSSHDAARDVLSGPGRCGQGTALGGYLDRCGPGPRQPLLVISPYAKRNTVDHTLTTQVSVTRFIEDNWLHSQRLGGGSFDATAGSLSGLFDFANPDIRPLILDPSTGLLVS